MTNDKRRQTLLAQVHIAKKDLGLDDQGYQDILWLHFAVRSAKDLTDRQLTVLVNKLKARGWQPTAPAKAGRKPFAKGRPPADRAALLQKIEAHLAERDLPWSYAHGMAKKICKVDAIEFCDASLLRKIVAAFEYDSARKGLRKR